MASVSCSYWIQAQERQQCRSQAVLQTVSVAELGMVHKAQTLTPVTIRMLLDAAWVSTV